ncbi:MAG: hypothetical protein RL360_688 [Bacteroidota bacterium]|jgi:hypothetical protein
MMVLIIMDLVYKIFNMYKIAILFFIFSYYANSQVVPMGTIIKGKRLPTLNSLSEPDENNKSATLSGSIKINDSKLSIIENGFVVLLSSDSRTPDVLNASKYSVSAGVADFSITVNNFSSNTSYKYRAYAKNSKGEFAYSQIITFITNKDYCEVNPCKNGASCTSYSTGPLCRCTVSFCGNCCAQLADTNCPGGGDNLCNASFYSQNSNTLKIIKIDERVATNFSWQNSQLNPNQITLSKIEN